MEGSFADAVKNHGAKKARWRGLWRQQIQSWLIAAMQNLRVLLRHQVTGPVRAAAATLARATDGGSIFTGVGRIVGFRLFLEAVGSLLPVRILNSLSVCNTDYGAYSTPSQLARKKEAWATRPEVGGCPLSANRAA
jgi:hypothetical protein